MNNLVSEKRGAAGHDFRWRLLPSGLGRAGRVREQETRSFCDSAVSDEKGVLNDGKSSMVRIVGEFLKTNPSET